MRKVLLRALVITALVLLIAGSVQASPLDVKIEEKVNTTVNTTWQNGNYVQQYKTNVTGYLNITNNGNDVISDIWIAVNFKNITGNPSVVYKSDSNIIVDIIPKDSFTPPPKLIDGFNFNYSTASHIIHITYLKPGDLISIFYDVDDSSMGIDSGSPFIVNETYNVSKISARQKFTWNVWLNVSLNETWFSKTAITDESLTLTIVKYLSNDTNNFGSNNWKYLNLSGDIYTNKSTPQKFDSPYTAGTDENAFKITNILLNTTSPSNKYVNVSFNVTGYCDISSLMSLEPFGFATFEFNLTQGQNVSGTYIVDVFAVGNVTISATKFGPEENATGDFSLWKGNATVNNTANGLAFVITNLTVWATEKDINKVGTPLNDENNGNKVINSTNPWVTIFPWSGPSPHKYTGGNISFNYSQVPIVWANCTFKVIHDNTYGWYESANTTNATNATYGSDYLVIEKIYVIGTYLVKVTKHVIPNSSNQNVYDIYLVVENIGPMKSPDIYVYDLIPENFSAYNWDNYWNDTEEDGNWVNQSTMLINNGTNTTPLPSGYSLGLWWQLHGLNGRADGDGRYDDWAEISNNQSVVIFYQVKGEGAYKLMDAFVVGIDPMYSMNTQTAHKITIVSGAKATSYESLMALMCGLTFFGVVVISRRNGKNKE